MQQQRKPDGEPGPGHAARHLRHLDGILSRLVPLQLCVPGRPAVANQLMSLILEQQDDMLTGTLQLSDYFSAKIPVMAESRPTERSR